jgi:hypothetical protein
MRCLQDVFVGGNEITRITPLWHKYGPMDANGSVTVGKLEELGHPIQRYLLPLQSVEQALWVILCVTVSAAVVFAFDILFATEATSIRGWIMIVVSSLACSLPGWVPLLPERFLISTENDAQKVAAVQFLKDQAYDYGYEDISQGSDEIVLSLVSKRLLFSWLGWLVANQSKVRIAQVGTNVSVTGPGYAVRYLRKVSVMEFGEAKKPGR